MAPTNLRIESLESRKLMAADVLSVDYTLDVDTASAQSPATAEINFVEVAGGGNALGKPLCYLKYELDRAFVKPSSISSDADDRPVETRDIEVDAAFASGDLM